MELLHAFALRRTLDLGSPSIPLQQGVGPVIDAVKEVMDSFVVLEAAKVSRQRDEASRRRQLAVSSLRMHGALVRGWAYYTDMSHVLVELFDPIEDDVHASLGVRIRDLVQWWWSVTEAVETRIATHRELVRQVAEAPLDDDWPTRVREAFLRLPVEPDTRLMERLRRDEEQRRGFAIIAGDLNLYDVFGFTLEELIDCYPESVPATALQPVLMAWSQPFGATSEARLNHLVLENPVVDRPVVRLTDRLYLWALSSAFHHSAFPMLERLINADDLLREEIFKRAARSIWKKAYPRRYEALSLLRRCFQTGLGWILPTARSMMNDSCLSDPMR